MAGGLGPWGGQLLEFVTHALAGSGDPEAGDAVDCQAYLDAAYPNPAAYAMVLKGMYDQVRMLDPRWVHEPALATVPDLAVGQTVEVWAHPWHLGYMEDASFRGKAKTVHVLDLVVSFLERTFKSAGSPLKVAFPAGAVPGNPLKDFHLVHCIGLTRSLAAKMIMHAVAALKWTDEGYMGILPVLQSLLLVRVVYSLSTTEDEARLTSLEEKFQVSESVRPDVLQIYYAFRKAAEKAGEDFQAVIDKRVKAFNARSSIQGFKLSDTEIKVVKMLPQQTATFMNTLSYHWQNYKNGESAVPLKMFGKEGAFEIVDSDKPGVWGEIYKASPEKNEFTLLFLIGSFLKAIKDAVRNKKKVNLRNQAGRLRVQDPKMAHKMACVWVHFRSAVQNQMTTAMFVEAETMFFRGCLNRELMDKVKAENPTLHIGDMRFISMLTGDVPVSATPAGVDAAAKEAEAQHEAASLQLFQSRLQKDTARWDTYLAAVQEFEERNRVCKRDFNKAMNTKLKGAVEAYRESTVPVRHFDNEAGIPPWVEESAAQWAERELISKENLYFVYWVDFTKVAYTFNAVANKAARIVADALCKRPETSIAVFIAPNTGSHGTAHDDEAVEKAHDDCEMVLKQEQFKMKVRRGWVAFQPEGRSGYKQKACHPLWVCINDRKNANGEPACRFVRSRLWAQGGLTSVPRKTESAFVSPLSILAPGTMGNISIGQRLKQRLSGMDMMDRLRDAVWQGLDLSLVHGGVYVDLFGYDDSLTQTIIHGACMARPAQPKEMAITTVFTAGDSDSEDARKRLSKWIAGAGQRTIERLVRAKTLVLKDLSMADFEPLSSRPSYDTKEFVYTMPSADGALPLKQAILDEWQNKFSQNPVGYQEVVESHNQKYNPSGVPFKDGGKRRATASADVDLESAAQPFPAEATSTSLDALKAEAGPLSTIKGTRPELFDLVADAQGRMYLHALADGVVSDVEPLCFVYGRYHTGKEVLTQERKKCNLMPMKIESEYTASWRHPEAWLPPFPQKPMTLDSFMEYLEQHGVVEHAIVCHDITETADGAAGAGLTIKQAEKCAFEPLKTATRTLSCVENFGSQLDFSKIDWSTGKHEGGVVALFLTLRYEDSLQARTITPGKPGIFLTNAYRILQGKVYHVA